MDTAHGSDTGTAPSATLKWWRRFLIVTIAVSAAAASFVFLRDLALHAGWPPWAAVLLPLSIDALAAAALTEYRLSGSKGAGAAAVLAIVGSAVGNAYSHLYTVGLLEPDWVAVTLVGAVPPIALGITVHLFVRSGTRWTQTSSPGGDAGAGTGSVSGSGTGTGSRPTPTSRRTSGARGAGSGRRGSQTSAPSTGSSKGNGTRSGSSSGRDDSELIERVWMNSWQHESQNRLASLLNVSKTTAGRVQRAVRAQGNGHVSSPPAADDTESAVVA